MMRSNEKILELSKRSRLYKREKNCLESSLNNISKNIKNINNQSILPFSSNYKQPVNIFFLSSKTNLNQEKPAHLEKEVAQLFSDIEIGQIKPEKFVESLAHFLNKEAILNESSSDCQNQNIPLENTGTYHHINDLSQNGNSQDTHENLAINSITNQSNINFNFVDNDVETNRGITTDNRSSEMSCPNLLKECIDYSYCIYEKSILEKKAIS